MDPERVRGYLQVACAGLGFDIGEIWWTSNESGSSALATVEEKKDDKEGGDGEGERKLRFVQLYTSKSYADRRSMLVSPDDNRKEDGESETALVEKDRPCSPTDLKKHVLSPQLVDAISKSAQVVWANCQKKEGLLGRSDMRLQTAVGMPVAVDSEGNMCVVVMFSPENLESTDDAMEYLRFISRSATSSSIPCLLPVFDSKTMRPALMPHAHDEKYAAHSHPPDPSFGEGVVAHYVPIDEEDGEGNDALIHSDHDLTSAPKDCFGIPMLPSFAELGGPRNDTASQSSSPLHDPFDEASFGVWATIMHTPEEDSSPGKADSSQSIVVKSGPEYDGGVPRFDPLIDQPIMPIHRRERLEEFSSAFLEMSVFDVSDVWMPTDAPDTLGHVTSIVSTDKNSALNDFTLVSQYAQIKLWSGAVGRAFASGNPVWSANFDVIADSARAAAFAKAKIKTALAVPIFSSGSVSPACVLCCYSLVRAEAVPTVLRFVQQALRLLWTGLDKVEPHQSIGKDLWRDVAPADLGEMAADIEMHNEFSKKKRPFNSISASSASQPVDTDPRSSLSEMMRSIELRGADSSTRQPPLTNMPLQPSTTGTAAASVVTPNEPPTVLAGSPETLSMVQAHLQDAVRAVQDAVPWTAHQHLATNSEGTKRAHVLAPEPVYDDNRSSDAMQTEPELASPPESLHALGPQRAVPLAMPHPLVKHKLPSQPNTMNATTSGRTVQRPPAYQNNVQTVNPVTNGFVNNLTGSTQQYLPGSPFQHQPVIDGAAYPTGVVQPVVPMPGLTGSMSVNGLSTTSQHGLNVAATPHAMPKSASSPAVAGQVCMPAQAPSTNKKICRIQGCDEPAVTRRPYCQRHSGNRLCEYPGCTKCAQGSTRFCIAHGGGRRCTFPGCDKGARDKFFCAAHGGGKRCSHEGCTKSAVGGSNLCTSHGGGKRCAVEGCDKSAQSSTKFCVKHGGGKKCAYAGCEKVARGRTQFCAAHGGGVRCKLEGCNRVAIGKLQLCRSHGGGSRSRAKNATPPFVSSSNAA